MIIWTSIRKSTYQELKKGNPVSCALKDTPWGETKTSKVGYQFVADALMKQTHYFPTELDTVPWTGWVRYQSECSSPEEDDDSFFWYPTPDRIYVKLEVPDREVLLSDATVWDQVMRGEYVPMGDDLEDLKKELERYHALNDLQKAVANQKSWSLAFDVDPDDAFVLGSFWTIRPDMLIE